MVIYDATLNFLILGGYGNTGLNIARLLLKETSAHLVLAGRHVDAATAAAEQLNRDFPGTRVSAAFADAADQTCIEAACRGTDFVIAASSTARYAENVAEAALRAGIDYLDIHYSPANFARLSAMSERIQSAGRCFITEAGFHPGLAAALAFHVAAGLDRVDEITVAALINQNGGIPLTDALYEFVEELRSYRPLRYRNGAWRPASWFSMRDLPVVNFGNEFGIRRCFPMMLEEMRKVPIVYPTLRTAGFFVAGSNWFVDWIATPIAVLALWLMPNLAVRPVGRMLHWGLKTCSNPPWGVAVKASATGLAGDNVTRNELLLCHEDGYMFTAIPVVACLLQCLDGTARKPGLWMMGHLVDPVRLVRDMERMGIRRESVS